MENNRRKPQSPWMTRSRRLWMMVQLSVVSIFLYQCAASAPPTSGMSPTAAGSPGAGGWSNGPSSSTQTAPPVKSDQIKPPQSEGAAVVEEADIYRIVGDKMFVLHRHKGLLILDIKNAESPHKIAFLPLDGVPAEMFVDKETAYLLMQETVHRDVTGLELRDITMKSALISVDIRDLRQPKILQRAGLSGRVVVGSSRRFGTRLYVVVRDPNAAPTWQTNANEGAEDGTSALSVTSVDVSDPQRFRITQQFALKGHSSAPMLIGKHSAFEMAPSTNGTWFDSPALRSQLAAKRFALGEMRPLRFLQFVVTGTEGHLLVSETWLVDATMWTTVTDRVYSNSRGGCFGVGGSQTSIQEVKRVQPFKVQLNFTVVNVLDLRDASGEIKLAARFRLHGLLPDQTKQHVIKTADGRFAYIGVTMRNQLEIDGSNVASRLANVVASVDISDIAKPTMLDDIFFGKEREAVRATYFDTQRQALYAITSTADPEALQGGQVDFTVLRERRERLRLYDPLYTISLAKPESLGILGDLDDLNGDMNLFRPIQGGDYLIAVGRDTSANCTGFEASTGRYSRTSVSLVDVRDLKKPRLVQRRCIGVQLGAAIVSSEVNWDLDQAHKQIGLYTEGDTHLISVPVQFERSENGQRKAYTAVGLMRWDLRRDDPSKAAAAQDVLQELGTFLHPRGRVERTFFMMLDYAQQPRLSLLNFSQDILSVTDLENLEKPRLSATFEMAPLITHAFPFKDRILLRKQTLESLGASKPTYRWEHRKITAGVHLEDGALIESWQADAYEKPMAWGGSLLVDRGDTIELRSFEDNKSVSVSIKTPQGWGGLDAQAQSAGRKDGRLALLTEQGILAVGHTVSLVEGQQIKKHRVFFLSLLEKTKERAFVEIEIESKANEKLSLVALGDGDVAVRLEVSDGRMPQHRVGFLRWSEGKWLITPFSKSSLPGLLLHRFAEGRVLLSMSGEKGLGQVLLGRITEEGVLIEQSLNAPAPSTFTDIAARGEDLLLATSDGYVMRYRHDAGFLQFVRQWQIKSSYSWRLLQWTGDLLLLDSSVLGEIQQRILALSLQDNATSPQAAHYAAIRWLDAVTTDAPRSTHVLSPLRTHWIDGKHLFFAAEEIGIVTFELPSTP